MKVEDKVSLQFTEDEVSAVCKASEIIKAFTRELEVRDCCGITCGDYSFEILEIAKLASELEEFAEMLDDNTYKYKDFVEVLAEA